MPAVYEENRLISLLHKFDTALTLSYLQKIKKLKDALEDTNLIHYFDPIKDPTLADPIAFRVELSEPIFVMLSHPLCRMHTKIPYPIEFEWERFYVTQLGMLPVFFVDFNTITLIKFWSEAAEQMSPQALKAFLGNEAICMELTPSKRNIHYSTMNFVIAFGAQLWKTRGTLDEIIQNYMKYSYWATPKSGYSFSTHFLHTKASISYVLKVAKTLCLIDEIDGYAEIQILNRPVKVHKIRMRMLTEKNGSFFFVSREAYVPKDVLSELLKTQERDKIKLEESFLNAIVLEVREKTGSFELLSVISDIGASYFELTQTLISFLLMRIFDSGDKIAYVCTANELKASFEDLLDQVGRYIKLSPTLSERIEGAFYFALESLYPIFIHEGNTVYFLHPLIFSYLYSKPKSDFLFQKDGKGQLLKFLHFIEKVDCKSTYMELYLDETLDALTKLYGKYKKEVLSKLFNLTQSVKISKLLRRCF